MDNCMNFFAQKRYTVAVVHGSNLKWSHLVHFSALSTSQYPWKKRFHLHVLVRGMFHLTHCGGLYFHRECYLSDTLGSPYYPYLHLHIIVTYLHFEDKLAER